MIKEFLKQLYTLFCQLLGNTFQLVNNKKENRVLFVYDFHSSYSEIENEIPAEYQIIKIPNKVSNVVKIMWVASQSNYIFVDNYMQWIAAASSKNIVQYWHASTAVKKFGMYNQEKYSGLEIKRFKKVYNKFTHICVNSEFMKEVFITAFGITNPITFIESGYVKNDIYFTNDFKINSEQMIEKYVSGEKYILYLPTFRKELADNNQQVQFLNNYQGPIKILYSLHPAIAQQFNVENAKCVRITDFNDVRYLLDDAQLIISDYSSLLLDAAFRNKHVIQYCYDYAQYNQENGLLLTAEDQLFAMYKDANEIYEIIAEKPLVAIEQNVIIEKYYTYETGQSGKKIVNTIFGRTNE